MSANNAAARPGNLKLSVRAAGGLVLRRGPDEGARIVLVHRPRYDDWSFPKGKQRRTESLLDAALREVREETGFFCVAEAVVGVTEYIDRRGRPKLVRYWAMDRINGTFSPNAEVDAIAWVRPSEAILRLTHEHDRLLLDAAVAQLEEVLESRDRSVAVSSG